MRRKSIQARLLDELRDFDRRHPGWDLTILKVWIAPSRRGAGPGQSVYAYVADGFAFEVPVYEPESHDRDAAEGRNLGLDNGGF